MSWILRPLRTILEIAPDLYTVGEKPEDFQFKSLTYISEAEARRETTYQGMCVLVDERVIDNVYRSRGLDFDIWCWVVD